VLLFALGRRVAATTLIALIPRGAPPAAIAADALRARHARASHSSLARRGMRWRPVRARVVLLVGAGLLVRTAWVLDAVDVGFRADHAVR